MKKVITIMFLVVAGVLFTATELYKHFVPQPVATAVIAEKPEKVLGGQVAVLLPESLSEKQARLLSKAQKMAKADGLSPAIVQSVLLQETNAGGMKSYRVANPGSDAYFGPMQIKLSAAKDVLRRFPGLFEKYKFHTRTDDEIKAYLILDDAFNIEVGTKYLRLLREAYGFTGRELMNAYNRGPGGVKYVDNNEFHYAIGAERKLAAWKRK